MLLGFFVFSNSPFFRICNAEVLNISICNAKKQPYAAAVPWQPPNAVDVVIDGVSVTGTLQ